MRKELIILIFLVSPLLVIGQVEEEQIDINPPILLNPHNEISKFEIDIKPSIPTIDSLDVDEPIIIGPTYWTKVERLHLDINEVAFVNWNSGGVNTISAVLGLEMHRDYKRDYLHWNNELILEYGLNKQKDFDFRKTDDKIELNSTFGYQTGPLSEWYYSAKLNFKTQFAKGFNYPNTQTEVSQFMAPGYLFLGVGAEYNLDEEKNLAIYLSPLTMKSTFVLDQKLADSGAFGVRPAVLDEFGNVIEPGRNLRTQIGILITNEYKAQLFENIGMVNKLSLYTDYLNEFGNIDVNWELNLVFQVNEYVVAKLGSHLIYDDDIEIVTKTDDGEVINKGPAVQWKQQLGLGVIVNL